MRSIAHSLVWTALVAGACAPTASGQGLVHEYLAGLRGPMKLVAMDDGNILVAEAGAGANTGRISIIDRDRRRFTIVDGLPSARFNGGPTGPSGVLLVGRRLFITIGGGDVSQPGPAQGSEIPNPTPTSPLFSSILLLEFDDKATRLPLGFWLPPESHQRLGAGEGVYLTNVDGETARISRFVDFPDYVPEPRPDVPNNVRSSNPFGLVGHEFRLDVNDASRNLIFSVDTARPEPRVLVTFPPVPNRAAPMGPPLVDAVPSTIRGYGDWLLVSYLTGFPFAAGNASLQLVDRHRGVSTPLMTGLQTAIDVLPIARGTGLFYVLEHSQQLTAGGPGRLLRIDALDRTPLVLADALDAPTSLAFDPVTRDVLITELHRNRIVRVQVP
jgi:hypothetical protein